jgi:hypothetical protein
MNLNKFIMEKVVLFYKVHFIKMNIELETHIGVVCFDFYKFWKYFGHGNLLCP